MAADPVPAPSAVLASYAEGVAAIEQAAAATTDWSGPTPCSEWDAHDIAGHLVAVARYYHDLLDYAEMGKARTDLPRGTALARMNTQHLAARPEADGPMRIDEFALGARSYLDRVKASDWNLLLGQWDGAGPLTVGQHAGVAAAEWHVHAWDLARAAGRDYRPSDVLTVAAAQRVLPETIPEGEPWEAILVWSGRDHLWSPAA